MCVLVFNLANQRQRTGHREKVARDKKRGGMGAVSVVRRFCTGDSSYVKVAHTGSMFIVVYQWRFSLKQVVVAANSIGS